MKVKIWGARGSIPTPLQPAEVREKVISAILDISKIQDGAFREELIAAILESDRSTAIFEQERRQLVEEYLDHLSPLAGKTAGGNTACIEISSGEDIFIIDAGSGIRQLGLELMRGPCGQGKGVIHLFFTHPHWDHVQGFPFFRPAFVPGNKIFLYSVHDIETVLRRQQESITFPVSLDYMQAERTFIHLEPGEVLEFGDVRVRNRLNHHPGNSYSFRFEKGDKAFVFATDASYPTGVDLRPHLDFFADANLLIFDAQFTQRESDEKEDWGHSSSFVGVEMAQAARVDTLAIYHYDPTYTDAELEKILADACKFQQNQYPDQKPVNIILAEEGQSFDLTPSQAGQLQQVPGGNVAILKPTGVFDEQVVAELKEQLKTQNGWPAQLIIDMSEVDLLQVTGLRALVRLRKEATGTHLALAGPSINVQQLIELAGYLDFFAIYPSVHAALNALRVRETLNLPGQILKGRYEIEAKIGEGILGAVFKATDNRLDQPVAVKVLSASFSEEAIEQFITQGRQIVDLDHPNIVNVYDCDEEHGLSFLVEELIEGQRLDELIAAQSSQPVPFDVALAIAHDIALGLEYAHTHNVIHGDLKPKNVLLANRPKITDFGLGRLESGRSLLNLDVPLALATAHYLAPEQIVGHPIDGRTDLYALGVIMYELFTGHRPFEGTEQEVLEYHRGSAPRPPRDLNPILSPSLEHVILKLLDKDPNKRYATARRVRRILESIVPPVARHTWPPLVGRDKLLQRLTDLWAETQQGRGQLVFITGVDGLGATRLARELAQHAGEAIVLSATCQKLSHYSAYGPFIDALQTHLAVSADDDPLRQILPDLCRFVPEMASLLPQTDSSPADSAVPVSLADMLISATTKRPWLLILDNLHWADPASLSLLRYLAQHIGRMRLMIVGVHTQAIAENGGETTQSADFPLLTEFLDKLKNSATYTTLTVEPLSQAKIKELLENLWGQTVPLDLAAAIYRRSHGNPLFAAEISRLLMDEGVVTQREGKWRLSSVVEADLPQTLSDTILRRINSLSKETQTLLAQAATLGLAFNFEDLHEMSDLSQWDALENVDIALERQLLEEAPAEGLLRFKHPLIEQVLDDNLGQLKCRLLHRDAGVALERRYADTSVITIRLAEHYCQAEVYDKAFAYSLKATQQANALYATPTALYWYDQALAALDHLPTDSESDQQRFDLLLAREWLYHRLGRRKAQAADLNSLDTLAQTLNDLGRQAATHQRRAEYERVMGRLAKAKTAAESGLEAARQAKNPSTEADSLVELGRLAGLKADFTAMHDHFYAARQLYVDLADRSGEAHCYNGLAAIAMHLNDYAQAENDYQQALTLAAGDRAAQATTLANLGRLYVQVGDYNDAFSSLGQALALNRLLNHRQGEAICWHYLALTLAAVGQYDPAKEHLEQALAIRRTIGDSVGEAEDARALGLTCLAMGDYAAARDNLGQALEAFQSLKVQAGEGDGWLLLGLAQEGLNDRVKAKHAYEQARRVHEQTGHEAGVIEARAGMARCRLASGQINAAKTEIETCLAWLTPHGALGINQPVRLYLTAYCILQAANCAEAADEALNTGLALLRHRADNIGNDEWRNSFLEKVVENQELLNL